MFSPRLFVFIILSSLFCLKTWSQNSEKLTGKIIGIGASVDYSTNSSSTTVNTKENAFDGDLSTFFASYARSNTWAGLDLGTPHVITKVGWSPRNDSNGPKRVQLGIFEGSNDANFLNSVPLYMVTEQGTIGTISYANVETTKGFRYVRYVGPNNARCNIAELEFYGYESEGTEDRFYHPTNLPLVVVHVENGQEPYDKEHELSCIVSIITDKGYKRVNDDGEVKDIPQILTDTAKIRLRGNASKNFDKKPYRIKFSSKHHVLDSPSKDKKWTLINNYGDKTLMRNILAFDISRRLEMEYTPYCTPVDVMVNGEYKGCYQLCDQVEVGKHRVDIEEMDETCTSGEELSGGYFCEIDAYGSSEPVMFYSNKYNPVVVKYPKDDEILDCQFDYIEDWFNGMETRLYTNGTFTSEGSQGYRSRLNLDSFLRHFLVGEISGNTDTYWSVNIYKHRSDDHFYVGPCWDFDLAFENDNRTYPINKKTDFIFKSGSYAGDMKNFASRIVNSDSKAWADLKNIYALARMNGMGPESLTELVDETAEILNESQRLNFIRWPILNSYVHQNPQVAGSYQGEVNVVKNYINERFTWMDKKLVFDPSSIINGINSIAADSQNSNLTCSGVYTLAGQPATYPLQPGIYIQNGHKFIVR